VDGKIVNMDLPIWSSIDRLAMYGDGLFETVRIGRGQPHDLDLHLERLVDSARDLGFAEPESIADTAYHAVSDLLLHAGMNEGALRITLSRGVGKRGYQPDEGHNSRLIAQIFPLPKHLEKRARGVHAIVTEGLVPGSLAQHKTCSAIIYVEAARRAHEAGVEEALLEDGAGGLSEAAGSNLFALIDGVLMTPPTSYPLLAGITRGWVLHQVREALAGRENLLPVEVQESGLVHAVTEKQLTLEHLRHASEVFLTNSVTGVTPLVSVDEIDIAGGGKGQLARSLQTGMHSHWNGTG
jgi:branched-subunit amino acid aminotransferase/4-amino-4-deoxychorismate lyase